METELLGAGWHTNNSPLHARFIAKLGGVGLDSVATVVIGGINLMCARDNIIGMVLDWDGT